MKKFLLMAAMVLSSVGAFAQYEGGEFTIQPKVGINAASIDASGSEFKVGFVGGVEGEYHFNKLVGLSFGLLYSQEGAKVKDYYVGDVKIKEKYNIDYLNVPILANFYVVKGLAVKAGIQPGFKLSGKKKVEGEGGNETAEASRDIDGLNSVNFSIPVGISYEYANVCLDARYNIGVSHVWTDGNTSGQVFQLTIGYKFKL